MLFAFKIVSKCNITNNFSGNESEKQRLNFYNLVFMVHSDIPYKLVNLCIFKFTKKVSNKRQFYLNLPALLLQLFGDISPAITFLTAHEYSRSSCLFAMSDGPPVNSVGQAYCSYIPM